MRALFITLFLSLPSLLPQPALASLSAGCTSPISRIDTSTPDAVVGSGTPATCTEAALTTALASGGVIVFDCGPDPVVIPISTTLQVVSDTVLDGGNLVTLDGGNAARIIAIQSFVDLPTPTLTVQRMTFENGSSVAVSGSDAERGGGAIWARGGTLAVIDSTFRDNSAPSSGQNVAGGAIYVVSNQGSVTIATSTFENNSASNGGAIGVLQTPLVIANSVVTGNTATGTGGNPGLGGNGGGLYIDATDETTSVCGLTLSSNDANAFGGGVFHASSSASAAFIMDRSAVIDNGIPLTSSGGGMYLQGLDVEITASTFARNEAASAGAIRILSSTLDMTNVTIAENTALTSVAGGLALDSAVTGTILNVTFARNAAPGATAYAAATFGGQNVVLQNSVIDGQTVGNPFLAISCSQPFIEGGGNLQWPVDQAGGGSDDPANLCSPQVLVADSRLAPLTNNGGPTSTILLGAGSPALNHGAGCPATDQRGVPRDAMVCDAGAIELTAAELTGLVDLGDRTRDESTGLEWLDLAQTQNLSYNAVLGGAGGWVAEGWRHATLAEVCELFSTYAVAPSSPCGTGSEGYVGDGVVALQTLLGITRALPGLDDTFGFVDNLTAGPDVGIGELRYSTGGPFDVSTAGVDSISSIWDRDGTSPNVGHFLVRAYAPGVPSMHPIALYTLVPGLLVGVGLVAMRRRQSGPSLAGLVSPDGRRLD